MHLLSMGCTRVQVWRGWLSVKRFLQETKVVADPKFLSQLEAHISRLESDLHVAVAGSLVKRAGKPYFLPPFAATGFQPFDSMAQSTRRHEPGNGCPDVAFANCSAPPANCSCQGFAGGPTYAGFRYYSEMLSSGFLSPSVATAIASFREEHMGTVSSLGYLDGHLDSMQGSGYAHAAVALRRTDAFLALLFGQVANYHSRGTFNAPEQLGMCAAACTYTARRSPV